MAKEALILKILLDEIPRTMSELATMLNISDTHVFNLCTTMAKSGAINLRKSGGTWIAWRSSSRRDAPIEAEAAQDEKQACLVMKA